MISANTKLKPDPDVVFTSLPNGEVVLLHLRAGQYFSLNETGSYIWQLVNDGYTQEEIWGKVEEKYDVTPEKAQHSVSDLVAELVTARLLLPIND